jgi:hypothetical protein
MAKKLGAPRSPRPSHGRRAGGGERRAVGHLRGDRQCVDEHATGFDLIKLHRGQVMHNMRAESLADLVRMAENLGRPAST